MSQRFRSWLTGIFNIGDTDKSEGIGASKFIIGTEEGILYRLNKENPEKVFYSFHKQRACYNMKKTTLQSVKDALEKGIYEITIPSDIMRKAQVSIERMIQYI